MKLDFTPARDRSRFSIDVRPEEFDGHPGLAQIWFDGLNEPISADAAALAGWILLAPFVSRRVQFNQMISRPLANQMMLTWGAPIEIAPIDDEPKRFPERIGTLLIEPASPKPLEPRIELEQPLYRIEQLPLNASGTSYVGEHLRIKTNAKLTGHGLVDIDFSHLLAPALLYADFFGIRTIAVPGSTIDCAPPSKRPNSREPSVAWRELIKHAGFDLQQL